MTRLLLDCLCLDEGRQREECFVDGHREDLYRYSLIASEWLVA